MGNDNRIKKLKKKIINLNKYKDMEKKLKLFVRNNEIELSKQEKNTFNNCLILIENKITELDAEILNTGEFF